MASEESWRTEAYCPVHSRQERIVRVRSAVQLTSVYTITTYHAQITTKCGWGGTIVTTARNLQLMEKSA